MTQAKPLSKERREEIEDFLTPSSDDAGMSPDGYCMESIYIEKLKEVLAAEQYWRESVKNAQQPINGFGHTPCIFRCGGFSEGLCMPPFVKNVHTPDCPLRLANEQ